MKEKKHNPLTKPLEGNQNTGILPYQSLKALIRDGEISGRVPIAAQQVQPASIDLRLGETAYRVQASFLPGPSRTVKQQIDNFCLHKFDLTRGALLEKGCVYLVPLIETLNLSPALSAVANPKSSIGRLDVFTRLITDNGSDFDIVPRGYTGPLYTEIFPRTFSVLARTGTKINQLRVTRGHSEMREAELQRLLSSGAVLDRDLTEREVNTLFRGVPLSVDLSGINGSHFVGFKSKPHAPLVDLDKVAYYDPRIFWEPIYGSGEQTIILNPDDFYILASKEAVSVPVDHAAEMVPYDAFTGEFRAHYAGFFDPGFGQEKFNGGGTRAVLEMRSYGVPFIIEDGQLVGRLKYGHLTNIPDKLYGPELGSSYQGQGLTLSKHFCQWPEI